MKSDMARGLIGSRDQKMEASVAGMTNDEIRIPARREGNPKSETRISKRTIRQHGSQKNAAT
jgi:hypothetical protein